MISHVINLEFDMICISNISSVHSYNAFIVCFLYVYINPLCSSRRYAALEKYLIITFTIGKTDNLIENYSPNIIWYNFHNIQKRYLY